MFYQKKQKNKKKSNAKTGPYIIISHILTIGRRLVTATSVVELDLAELIQCSTEDGRSISVFLLYGQLRWGQMDNFPAFIASKSFDL